MRQKNTGEKQREAFLRAFEEFNEKLFRHALFRTGNRERALELTQETFLKSWDYLVSGGEVQQFRSFLYRILNNLIIDEYRKMKERSLDEMLEDDTGFLDRKLSEGSRGEVEEEFDKEATITLIRERIDELPDTYRSVVTLRFVDGLSPKEIAAMMQVSENVVSVRIHRGVAKLRDLCDLQ